ncbi:DNA-methyltransferase [Spiroplasma endosymbiont of Glossina fuscipes fuscipes]|uniref:DNA-methyltransferase n=1 Tax=Spiroplasma endosymbiont of Glossina fuscipes fuscipes TaxID=2004463 RepID=UPI003C7065AC
MKTNLGELILGDSLEILKTIPDKSIDLILTDPPYLYPDIAKKLENKEKHIEYNLKKLNDPNTSNIQYQIRKRELEFLQGEFIDSFDIPLYFKEWMRIIKKPNFIIYLSKQQLKEYLIEIENYNLKFELIIYQKTNDAPSNNAYRKDKELCLYIYNKPISYSNVWNQDMKTIYQITNSNNQFIGTIKHPTVKDINLIKLQINKHSKVGDTVLDCFLGSGTTAIACEQLNCKWIGIEINEKYYNLTKERLKYVQPTLFY